MSEAVHTPPYRSPVGFAALLFGACAAPVFWLGQMMLGYGVTAFACFPGDHPQAIASAATLRAAVIAFDAVAIIAAGAGGVVSLWCWRRTTAIDGTKSATQEAVFGRARFLSLWGLLSSLWFLFAIIFSTIASITVPPC